MTPRNKAIWMLVVTIFLTVMLYVLRDLDQFTKITLPIICIFCSWNSFAYGFGKDMWPWEFVELKGGKEGSQGTRSFWFWFTAACYLAFLATGAFSDR